jgi:hypothetical protein
MTTRISEITVGSPREQRGLGDIESPARRKRKRKRKDDIDELFARLE